MGIFTWIIVGGIAGALGKLISPGDDGGGWILTIILGIVGAIVGGFISSALGLGAVTGFNIGSILVATGGAVLVLFIYKKFIA
ncbi:MAG: putative membrane protein YeaQ/YmgE (transglycosylase-associated protein family) [Spirosomataceae bacterium]|jgi:uncharacterized membrane protein YeaQ/YmgE (transglycosylase-associated protein family)